MLEDALDVDVEAWRRPVEYEYIDDTPRRHSDKRRFYDDDEDEAQTTTATTATTNSAASTPIQHASPAQSSTSSSRVTHAEEVFQKNFIGMLNKRGYNICDSGSFSLALPDPVESSSTSITSTGSASMSSLLLSLREPNHGQGPLHIAVRKGDVHVLNALLENACIDDMIDFEDNNGNTALHFAAGSWRRPQCALMVHGLLEAGADVHIENKRGLTPLAVHLLTLRIDNAAVVISLLECGADANTNVDGESVLHIAIKHQLPNICRALVAFGASLTALNNDGLMCFEAASDLLKRALVRSISEAPPFLSRTKRSKCMRCHGALLRKSRIVRNFLKRMLGVRIPPHQSNCYHCGLLFCSQCLKRTHVADALPAQFSRSRLDDLSRVMTCTYCEGVLTERRLHESARLMHGRRESMLLLSNDKRKSTNSA